MKEGDVEELQIVGDPFNVFNKKDISAGEYTFECDEETVIRLEAGEKAKLTAVGIGTAHIKITDKKTGKEISITRIVNEASKDRIDQITVNNEEASLHETSTGDMLVYYVKVITNENKGNLKILTKDPTDRISIEGEVPEGEEREWSYNGTLNKEVELVEKITEIPIKVGIRNNEGDFPLEVDYKLIVEKVTDDIGIKEITATSKLEDGTEEIVKATAKTATVYEVIVKEWTDISNVKVTLNQTESKVSIDGEPHEKQTQTKVIDIDALTKEVKITVTSEIGTEAEYTLLIHKESDIANLISLTVNDEEAKKISETTYAKTVDKTINKVHIKAVTENPIASVSINGNNYNLETNEIDLDLTQDKTDIIVNVKASNGVVKQYTLTIYRDRDDGVEKKNPALDMLIVNGEVIEAEIDKETYIAYLPNAEITAEVRAIAKENEVWVKIAEEEKEKGESTRVVDTINPENTYKIVLNDDEGNTAEYTLIIRKAETDVTLKEVDVIYGASEIEAKKVNPENYEIKVPEDLTEIDVKAITGYPKSKVQINEIGNFEKHENIEKVDLTEQETIVKIKVQSEDESVEKEYYLTIIKMSTNANLEKVEVDGEEASLGEDGNYHYYLKEAKVGVVVKAYTEEKAPCEAYVNIENGVYELYETERGIAITSKQTEVKIKVKAENRNNKNIYTNNRRVTR